VKQSVTRVNGQATINRLLKYSAAEIKRNGIANYDLDDVLRRSKTSKGSLYHHFGSKNGLIAATQSHTLSADIGRDNQSLRAFIEAAKSKDEMLAILDFAIQHGINSDSAKSRKRRIQALAFGQHDKLIALQLKNDQIQASEYLAETLQIAQDRGYFSPSVSCRGFAFWIQGAVFGHLLVEIAEDTNLAEEWTATMRRALDTFVR
jgi:AcrR family transcriptional regulator